MPERRQEIALKVVIMCELAGGRGRTAEILKIQDNTIDNYRHGKTEPTMGTMEKLGLQANVPLVYLSQSWRVENGAVLVGGGGLSSVPQEAGTDRGVGVDEARLPYVAGYDVVADLAGGVPDARASVVVPASFWERIEVDPRHVIVLNAIDDSMVPTVSDKALIFVDGSDLDLAEGAIYVLEIGNDLLIRRVRMELDNSIVLVPDNQADYQPRHLTQAQMSGVRVIGRLRSSVSVV